MGNTFKTAFLLTALTLLLMMIGRAFGGQNGMMIALAFAVVMNFVSYFFSDKIALAMYRAQPVTREELPRAYDIVERLTQKIGIPMPKIYVIPTESPNAFATGRNPEHASVAVTHGILGLLNDEEMEGVLAHELGHVRNRDILISSVAATIAGAITMLASMGRWAMLGRERSRGARRRRNCGADYADSGSDCCDADSAGGVPFARVSSGCFGSALHRESIRAGERAAKAGCLFAAHAHAGDALDGAPVYYSAAAGD
jgi:heat shock protein HtpX